MESERMDIMLRRKKEWILCYEERKNGYQVTKRERKYVNIFFYKITPWRQVNIIVAH